MRQRILSLLVVILAVVVLVISNYRHASTHDHEPASSQSAKRPMQPVKKAYIKGPRGKPGGIFLMNGDIALEFRVWFSKGCGKHEQAVDTVFQTYREHQGRIGVIGIFGIKDSKDKVLAKSMGWLGKPDVIHLYGTQKGSGGATKSRHIAFQGFEGKDYSIEEFRRAIQAFLKNDSRA
jgi:hypothetical protein